MSLKVLLLAGKMGGVSSVISRILKKRPVVVAGGILLAIIIVALVGVVLALPVYSSGRKLIAQSEKLLIAAKAQDILAMENLIVDEKNSLADFSKSLTPWGWTAYLPFLGDYWRDVNHATKAATALLDATDSGIKTVVPYADILGLQGMKKNETSTEKAKDRIAFVVSTIDKVAPQLDQIGRDLAVANNELKQINPARYPEEFRGEKIRNKLSGLIDLVGQANILINDARPVLEVAPWILGNDKKKTYLILFQNDAELRPTGGFWTGYAILSVDKGKLTPLFSGDIYDLDARYSGRLKAPEALVKYIADPYAKEQAAGKLPHWRLRDMNLSPDFRSSVETFLPEFTKAGGNKVDGVIAIDSQVLVSLLKVLGPIGVPGFGNFSADKDARCNCPQVIYQLESIIGVVTPYMRSDRKGVLGPLMHSVLANAIGSPKERMPALFETGLESVLDKHVFFYFPEKKVQDAMETFNLAGRVREAPSDYLFIVDSNMGGAKSNLYIQVEVNDTVEWKGESAVHDLTISYKNPQKGDQWLNAPYRNWFRIYVPKGARLNSGTGSEMPVKQTEELGKTVFEGFFTMRPLGVLKLNFKYEVPLAKGSEYSLLVQKQGGTGGHRYSVTLNGNKNNFELLSDKELRLVK
ncbi:MAG: hypothetical protein UW73_C0003G0005 [Microgenomates group bacterium GW2011_GWB1_44_8]|nr:MAG: hypothetical protein UW73_C0003G0005 [Microgenomates group bacterium GW2011_GWB1_44_8]